MALKIDFNLFVTCFCTIKFYNTQKSNNLSVIITHHIFNTTHYLMQSADTSILYLFFAHI